MEVLDIGLKRPAIINSTTLTTVVFMIMKVLECLRVTEDLDIGLLSPATLPLAIAEFIILVIKVVKMAYGYIGDQALFLLQ